MDNLQNFRKISPKTWKKSGNCEQFHFSFHYFIRVLGRVECARALDADRRRMARRGKLQHRGALPRSGCAPASEVQTDMNLIFNFFFKFVNSFQQNFSRFRNF